MKRWLYVTMAVAFSYAAHSLYAVKVDLPGEAEANATHIVTGRVSNIYSKTVRGDQYQNRHCIAEIKLESLEKGNGLKPGQVIYVRYIGATKWIGKGEQPPGPGPHENVPHQGQRVKVCLVKNTDESLDVYYVSGFKSVDPAR